MAAPTATSVGCNLERRGCKFSAYQWRSAFRSDAGSLLTLPVAKRCLLLLFARGVGDRFKDRAVLSHRPVIVVGALIAAKTHDALRKGPTRSVASTASGRMLLNKLAGHESGIEFADIICRAADPLPVRRPLEQKCSQGTDRWRASAPPFM
jgi:hypothetical protein